MSIMRWVQNRSLRTKATISVLLIIALAMSAFVTATIVQTNRLVAREQHHSLGLVAHGLANACELAMSVGDIDELARQSKAFLAADDDLLFVSVFDGKGRLMANAVRDAGAWERYSGQSSAGTPFILSEREVMKTAGNTYSLLDPIPGTGFGADAPSKADAIGRVVVAYSTSALQASQSNQSRTALLLGVVLLAMLVPAVYLIVRACVKRLERLASASESISRGDFSYSAVDDCEDEIGALARTFETMRGALEQREVQAKQFNDTLQQEVRQRTAQLEEALLAAEAANAAKTQFLANMSHEIRTPMTAILGYAELMVDPNQGPSDRFDCVQTISRNAGHLLSIVNDILDISKIEAGKMSVERIECSPAEVLADVASLMRGRAMEKNLDYLVCYDGPIPETIQTDPTRLRQILLNLSGNAIKFTEIGEVRIRAVLVNPQSPDGGRMRFEVIDTGVGMSESQIAGLFQPFSQADNSTTRKFGGTGLGLSISKRLANMLGGDITVASMPGRGATFSLEIEVGSLHGVDLIEMGCEVDAIESPPKQVPAFQPTPPAQQEATLHGVRVLLAEDGPDNQRLILFHLRRAGAIAQLAENGRIACDMAMAAERGEEPYDLVIMDMQMPELDGYTATSTLRMQGFQRPIIALTAHAMAGDREHCLSAGCDDYTTKPIDRVALIRLVARWAQRSRNEAA